jgi:hypothetical protein
MRFVLSLGVITAVLAAQSAANAGPPGEGGEQRGREDQRPHLQGENPHRDDAKLHHPKLDERPRPDEHPRQDAAFDRLHKGEHWPSNWTWRWYPGHGWYAPNGSYLVARPILDPIRIINPPENGVTLNYTLNGARFSIPPGHSQELNDDRQWVIGFSRGSGFGQAQYTLQPGRYHFAGSPGGWELFGPEPPAAGSPGVPPANPPPATNPSLPAQGNQPPSATVPPSLPAQGNQPPPPPTGPSSPGQGVQPPPQATGPSSPAQGNQPPPQATGPSSPAQGTQPPPQATDPSSPAQGTQPPPLPPGPF